MPEPRPPRARFRATVHYEGTSFRGWQIQPDQRTVQGVLETCLQRLVGARTPIDAAGRTDTGVHAVGQEIAFDVPRRWTGSRLRRALNAVSPGEIWIERVRSTASDFRPRFDASARRYEYLVGTRDDAASPIRRGRLWAVTRPVDERALEAATRHLPGERSFGGFAKSGQPQRGTRCHVEEAGWRRTPAGDLALRIVADRFLHHMVRYLVSTLIEIGTGRRSPEDLNRLLREDSEVRPPSPAPAGGLYLTGVRYPDGWNRPPGIPGVEPVSGDG